MTVKARDIVLTNELDANSVLNKYEDSSFTVNDSEGIFTGYQNIDVSMLSDIDNISDEEFEELNRCRVKYTYKYNVATNIVTISAEMRNEYGEIQIDELTGLAFTDENGKIDAVVSLDEDENILLSDLLESATIDNVGWLSRLFKKIVVVAVVAVVAVAVTVATAGTGAVAAVALVAATVAAVYYDVYEQSQAYSNYKHNQTLEKPNMGIVNGQGHYSEWRFGVQTFDKNGCGVIATYNVMYLLNKNPKLSEVAYDIEKNSGALAWGYAGTDPTHPIEYFKLKGIAVKQYYDYNVFDSNLKNMRTDQYAIVCFQNDKNDINKGVHFVAVSKEEIDENTCKFTIYNSSKYYEGAITVYNTDNIMSKGEGKLITFLIIN